MRKSWTCPCLVGVVCCVLLVRFILVGVVGFFFFAFLRWLVWCLELFWLFITVKQSYWGQIMLFFFFVNFAKNMYIYCIYIYEGNPPPPLHFFSVFFCLFFFACRHFFFPRFFCFFHTRKLRSDIWPRKLCSTVIP